MAQHLEPRRGRLRRALASRKVRALLCLGIFAVPAATGTMAYWTDEATIKSGTLKAGTLDLTVGATVADSNNLQGTGGQYDYSTLTISNLVPGESIARPFVVRNFGTTALTFNGFIYTTNNDLVSVAGGLRVAIYAGGTPTDTGTEAAGNRSGTCPNGTLLRDQAVSMTTNNVGIEPSAFLLAPGTTRSYCALIRLDAAAPNALQGKITQLVIRLDAKQVGAP